MSKKILYVLSTPPYRGVIAQETLDVVMTLGAFDQDVSLLLVDDAVFQIKAGQKATTLTSKLLLLTYQALPLYDINCIFIETESLTERGLTWADLSGEALAVNRSELAGLYGQFDVILSG